MVTWVGTQKIGVKISIDKYFEINQSIPQGRINVFINPRHKTIGLQQCKLKKKWANMTFWKIKGLVIIKQKCSTFYNLSCISCFARKCYHHYHVFLDMLKLWLIRCAKDKKKLLWVENGKFLCRMCFLLVEAGVNMHLLMWCEGKVHACIYCLVNMVCYL